MRSRIPALDGLRTIAIGLVLGFHFGNVLGGWIGVDVFFVLSGWLITSVLLTEHASTGGVRLGAFYLRRAARLYPALLVAVALHFAVSLHVDPVRELVVDAVAALTYVMDFAQGFGRLPQGWIGHTWSLAVEEQFYLLWPLVLLAALRWGRRGVTAGACGLGAVSLALMAAAPGVIYRTPAYFFPWTRAWELLAGCALAASGLVFKGRVARFSGPLGVALMVGAVLFAGRFGTPSGLRLAAGTGLAVASTLVILMTVLGDQSGPVPRVLSIAWVRWIGVRSYGIYLFEPPLHFGLRDLLPSAVASYVSLALIVMAAAASYRWVETPIRQRGYSVASRIGIDTRRRVEPVRIPDAGPQVTVGEPT